MKLRIGSRGSRLAMWQAHHAQDQLEQLGHEVEIIIIKTKGDKIQDIGFDKMEGKGFFTSEIEAALLNAEIDIAVHSMKDLPTTSDERLSLAGLSTRANPADVLVIHPDYYDPNRPLKIKEKSIVGTSSIRRKVQLSNFDGTLQLQDIRGNVPTRIQKVRDAIVHGAVLAAAGIERLELDLSDLKILEFNPIEFVPAPAQGVNAYQCRTADISTRKILSKIHQLEVADCTNIERKALQLMEGGCQVPIGIYVSKNTHGYHSYAIKGTEPGLPVLRINYSQSTSKGMAEEIVKRLNP